MPDVYKKLLPWNSDLPRALGRNIEHDPRSVDYPFPRVLPYRAMKTTYWERRCPVFDQGHVGSCTGNAAAGWVGTDNVKREGNPSSNEDLAVRLYSLATGLDAFPGEYPPDDTGSTGLAVAKALKREHQCRMYLHGFGLRSALTALQVGPVLFGTAWHSGMVRPDSNGNLVPRGDVEGGHEYIGDGVDMERKRVRITNSWSEGWGDKGRAWITFSDLDDLLSDNGDVTIPRV